MRVGFRTYDGTATGIGELAEAREQDNPDYVIVDKIIEFSEGQAEISVPIEIIDDESWEPDENFFIDLYDPESEEKTRLPGEDTKTSVLILDDDKPGIFGFERKTQ